MEGEALTKYDKIELLLTTKGLVNTTKVSFENSHLKLTSNHLIISEPSEDGNKMKNSIFHLDEIKQYQTIINNLKN